MIDRLKGAGLAFVVWVVVLLGELRARIHEARHPKKKKAAAFDPDHIPVYVPQAAGPLVETPVSKDPLLLTQVPVRSTKADAKREAHAYAEKRAGHPLTWKQARRLLNAWGRKERELERSMTPEYADRMRELSESAG